MFRCNYPLGDGVHPVCTGQGWRITNIQLAFISATAGVADKCDIGIQCTLASSCP